MCFERYIQLQIDGLGWHVTVRVQSKAAFKSFVAVLWPWHFRSRLLPRDQMHKELPRAKTHVPPEPQPGDNHTGQRSGAGKLGPFLTQGRLMNTAQRQSPPPASDNAHFGVTFKGCDKQNAWNVRMAHEAMQNWCSSKKLPGPSLTSAVGGSHGEMQPSVCLSVVATVANLNDSKHGYIV